jgi:CheY-like chemotaxis protein
MHSPAEQVRVLLVDDERLIADTLATIFSGSGYEARAAYSAEKALQVIGDWRPHLAIIDVFLPGMNGIDLAIRVREDYKNVRVLLFSGQAGSSDLLEGTRQQGHIFEILAKPVHPTTMLEVASRLLLLSPKAELDPHSG